MIEVRDGRLLLHTPTQSQGDTTLPTLDFECISAYVCPVCNNIIDAYIVGITNERTVNEYKQRTQSFIVGTDSGGSYLHDEKHGTESGCPWQAPIGYGIANGIALLCHTHGGIIPNALVDAVEAGNVARQGIMAVSDVQGNAAPLLIFNKHKMKIPEYLTPDHESEQIEKYVLALIEEYAMPTQEVATTNAIAFAKTTTSRIGRKWIHIPAGQATLF